MSWNDHVVRLCAGPSVKMAGIFGKDGIKWATSAGFEPTPQEVQLLLALANGKEYNGNDRITVCGQKYMYKDEPYEGLWSVLSLGGAEKYICTVGLTKTGAIITVALAAAAGASREYLDKYKQYLIGIGY